MSNIVKSKKITTSLQWCRYNIELEYKVGTIPANIYLFKFNNRNTRKRSVICS